MTKMTALTTTAVLTALAMIYVPYNQQNCNSNMCITSWDGFAFIFDPPVLGQINFIYLILELAIVAIIGTILYKFASKL